MKRILAIVLALAMVICLAACGGSTAMTMGTGGTAGTYYGYGGILGNQIKATSGITVNVVSTDGSKANILGIEQGNYQLGTV
ncbi:MAG: TAXI family TRAP transporter solute-binding subunit, partial [Acutalibacteraceae bacterium]|nr:TAXI family TRAP transporter solute-binding subunit [Acutalibacteraceae bacterium]